MSCATQEVKDLYHLLEHEFFPLDLASKVQPLLAKISKLGGKLASASSVPEVQLARYVPALEKLVILRLLQQVNSCFCFFYYCFYVYPSHRSLTLCACQSFPMVFQVSQVYQMMKIESLSQMIPFFDFKVVEKISVDAVKHNFIAMKVDHMRGVVLFGNLVSSVLILLCMFCQIDNAIIGWTFCCRIMSIYLA